MRWNGVSEDLLVSAEGWDFCTRHYSPQELFPARPNVQVEIAYLRKQSNALQNVDGTKLVRELNNPSWAPARKCYGNTYSNAYEDEQTLKGYLKLFRSSQLALELAR